MIEPGKYVQWRPSYNRPQWGRVLECEGDRLTVAVNGSTFEIELSEVWWVRRACIHCGRMIPRAGAKYCNRTCYIAYAHSIDDVVFDVIVAYKRANDGLTPGVRYICAQVGAVNDTVITSLRRLAKAGRIRFVGRGHSRGIAVVGGKWTYDANR